MRSIRILFLITLSVFLTTALIEANSVQTAKNQSAAEVTNVMAKTVTAEGVIQQQGMTTYQYGTHVLKDGTKTLYALMSKSQKLDNFVGKKVKITGTLVDGYPVDGGPDFVEVTDVEVLK